MSRYSFAWCSTMPSLTARSTTSSTDSSAATNGASPSRRTSSATPPSRSRVSTCHCPGSRPAPPRPARTRPAATCPCSHPEAQGLWCGHEGSVPRPIRSTHAEPADHLRRRAPRLPGHPPHRELPPDARLGEGQARVAVRAPGLGRRQRPDGRRGPGALPAAAPAQALPRLPARGSGHRLVDRSARRLARPAGGPPRGRGGVRRTDRAAGGHPPLVRRADQGRHRRRRRTPPRRGAAARPAPPPAPASSPSCTSWAGATRRRTAASRPGSRSSSTRSRSCRRTASPTPRSPSSRA